MFGRLLSITNPVKGKNFTLSLSFDLLNVNVSHMSHFAALPVSEKSTCILIDPLAVTARSKHARVVPGKNVGAQGFIGLQSFPSSAPEDILKGGGIGEPGGWKRTTRQ